MTIDEFICLQEAKLSTKARNKLDDEQFGIPELRKYPLTDRKHVLQAVRFFNKAEEKYKPELARNIVKRAKELNMDWENWDVLKPYLDKKYNESFLYEEYADELNAPKEANEICQHLSAYKYDNQSPKTWRLKSPEEVDKLKKGNCHDTAWYVYNKLDSYAGKKVGKGILFFVEYKEGKKEGGSTHSVCYEKIPGGICVIECSWRGMTGTFPYNTIDEYIAVVNKNWNFTKECDKLFATDIKNISNIHSGMTLGEYVDNATKNTEIIIESFIGDDDDDYEVHEPDDCYCESNKERVNDKGEIVPDKCTKCDSPIEIYLKGEPVYLCSNKKCGKYYGTVPCNINESADCYCESTDSNGITNAKLIASRIHEKVKKDSKPPTGNQNCMLCTMCAEAQFRGRTDMPRPVYSPRDPVLNILGESIVIHPRNYSLKSGFDDMLYILTENPDARFYCHVKWKNGNGGHEFLIITENGKAYIMDPQQGTFDKFLENHPYIKDLKWDESYLARMDNAEFNETVLRDFNTPESVVPWDAKLDIPYMLEHGMLSEEEAEQYWKEHPDEAPKDRHFLSFEELDKMSESKNIFTSGDFDKYGKDVDLRNARGPIQESFIMEFDRNSEKIPVKDINFDNVYFGSPKKYSRGIKIDRPLFVTPFMGIASIFIWNDMDIQNHVPKGTYNLQYEEWMHASDEELSKPFKEVHVYVEGYPELEPYEIENTGYIHTVNASKYKNDFYKYEGMVDKLEYLIDTDDSFVDVTSVQEVTVRYYISGKATNNPKLGPYKKNDQAIQESAWNDIKNGVNPHSKKLWFHVSRSDKHEGKTFEPRVPNYLYTQKEFGKNDPYYEDMTIPRICFSPSIEGALHAIIAMGDRIGTAGDEFYVYIPEKPINEYKHMTNKEIVDKKLVFDAKYTKECWITEPVKLILYGSIVIDQVYNHRTKPTANNQGRVGVVSYKWHWQTKPQVVKGTGHEAFAWNDGSNNNGKSKKDKSIKEAFDMSDFTRNPSVYKMFLEAEDSTEEETKDETMNETEVEIGSDISDIQNQYNAKDVEILNHLISSEADAISDYFEGSKNTKNPILTKLFSDIGEEERFHIEQLLFAKATLTGEKYEPRDPKVKKEYEELVELGMDEETAMTTAVDKLSISTKTEIGDGDDEEITDEKIEEMEDIAESFNMMTQLANAASFQTETILEAFADNTDVRVSLYETTNAFFEQAIFMEEVENLSTREGQKALGTKSPIKIIFNAFRAVYRIIIDIVKKIKLTFQKIRLRDKRRWQWIKRHGIKGLFQSGISMYFYSDKTNKFEVSDPLKYLILIHEINTKIVKDCGLNVNLTFDVDSFINMLTKNSPNSNLNIDVDKMRVKTIADGINLLRGVTLQKTKIIVTDANEAMLEDQFFGYTEEKYKMIENDENNSKINLSNNVYNQMGIIADALKALGIETENIIKELNNLEGTGGSSTVYSTNQKLYKLCVNSMGVITKSVNKFTAAVSSDISTMLNVNNGLIQAMQNADEDKKNKSEVDEYLKGRDQGSVSDQKDETEASSSNQPTRKPARQI